MKTRILAAAAVLVAITTPVRAEFSEDTKTFVRDMIRAESFNCHEVMAISNEGEDAFGTVLNVDCFVPGASWRNSVQYRVTLRADMSGLIIKPAE